jgi:hypothetical protein
MEKVKAFVAKVKALIVAHPFAAVLVAFVAGVVI